MQINFVGTGGAFDANYVNSSALVTLNDKKYLVDCGHSVFPELVRKDLVAGIDRVLITHLHDDHVGSVGTLVFYNYHVLGRKITVLLPNHVAYIEKFKQLVSTTIVHFEHYLNIDLIDDTTIKSFDTTGLHYEGMESFGYLFSEGDKHLLYSGDLGQPDFLFNRIGEMNIDPANLQIFHDISFYRNSAHAYYQDLIKWQDKYLIYGYHCNPEKNPKDNTIPLVFNEDSFKI
jgi:L-ascorbate metabolism protein UlaG (beta-lactamase superfamily)